jgi:hypothetical protein
MDSISGGAQAGFDKVNQFKNDSLATLLKVFNVISVLIGLCAMWVGCMGIYYGSSLIEWWPPITWNNMINGVFMV